AGTDHYQQARVATIEHGANGVAVVLDAFGERGTQRQALTQQGGAWQRPGAAAHGSRDGRRDRLGDGELDGDVLSVGGGIHDLAVPSAGAGDPAAALIECSFGWCQGSGKAAKSPVVAVMTVGAVSGHRVFLVMWPSAGRKNKNPRSGGRPGVRKLLWWRPCLLGRLWVSGAPVAKPIPKKVIADRRDFLTTQRHAAQSTGVEGGQGKVAEGHIRLLNANHLTASSSRLQAAYHRLITSTKRGVASLSMRRLWKSNSLRSASCEGTTFCK